MEKMGLVKKKGKGSFLAAAYCRRFT
jgi:hypothetical protein